MNNVASAREVLEHAQSMPENSVHRGEILCSITLEQLQNDSVIQLPIVLHHQD